MKTQLMAGVRPVWLLTRPLPVPVLPPEILIVNGPLRNRASTARPTVMETRHTPVPVQARNHPRKECPLLGLAVRVTLVP